MSAPISSSVLAALALFAASPAPAAVPTSSTSTTGPAGPALPPPPSVPEIRTGVAGVVLDAETQVGLPGAHVEVARGKRASTYTDEDGRYSLALPAGDYELRVSYDLYVPRRIRNVRVESRRVTRVDTSLAPDESAIEVVVVEARANLRRAEAVLMERQRAATVSDGISAEEMSRAPDSSASDAVKRVSAATIVDGRYVYIRGLGGRYASTLLNGVIMPSPDPDEQSLPLDLLPASLLQNMTIAKSYDASMPGTFAGGALMLQTSSYPTRFEMKLKLSGSGDSITTFRGGQVYEGGSLDFFGFDDGTRSLPESVPSDQPLAAGRGVDPMTVAQISRDFSNRWSTAEGSAYPNLGIGATLGGTTEAFGKDLGWLASLSFGHKRTLRRAAVNKVRLSGGELEYREQMRSESFQEAGLLGGLASVGLELSETDDLEILELFTHHGESQVVRVSGLNESDAQSIESTRLQFLARFLSFTQLVGRHRFPSANELELDWQANVSVAGRDDPDRRDATFQQLPSGGARLEIGPSSGERSFTELTELAAGGGASVGVPVGPVTLKAGGSFQRSSRSFQNRRFRYEPISDDQTALFLPADRIFAPENQGALFLMRERTLPEDSYDASLLVAAGFLSADVQALSNLRAIGGLRLEHARQTLSAGSPFATTAQDPPGADRSDTDLLPTLNLVFTPITDMNIRAAYAYTLARPQFRELAPFLYYDLARRRNVSGNPALAETRIHNGDLRWEWFLGGESVLAASVFAKRFQDPIEMVIVSAQQGDISYANAAGATSFGAELEARTNLAFLSKELETVRLGANLSWIRSRVELDTGGPQTSAERPLQGQSPYVLNVNAGWVLPILGTELGVLYNVYGPRIAEVGFDGLPDVYERPFHRLDATAAHDLGSGFALKVAASNLLNQRIVLEQGGLDVLSYEPGLSVMAALEYAQ